jgi:hypothetical protein
MQLRRGEFGLMAASSLLCTALPRFALADPDDDVRADGKHGLRASGKKHWVGATTATFLEHAWNFSFGSDTIAEKTWKYVYPQHGQASILIDYKGYWQYQGSFPAQKLTSPCEVTVGVGVKSSIDQIIAFTKTLTVSTNGASWSKHGHDQIVEDLWKSVVKGHE